MSKSICIVVFVAYHFIWNNIHNEINAKEIASFLTKKSSKTSENSTYVPLNSLTFNDPSDENLFEWMYQGPSVLRQMLEEREKKISQASDSASHGDYSKETLSNSKEIVTKTPNDKIRSNPVPSHVPIHEPLKSNDLSNSKANDNTLQETRNNEKVSLASEPAQNQTTFDNDAFNNNEPSKAPGHNSNQYVEKGVISSDSFHPPNKFESPDSNIGYDHAQSTTPNQLQYSDFSDTVSFNEHIFDNFDLGGATSENTKENIRITDRFVSDTIKEELSGMDKGGQSNVIWIYTTRPYKPVPYRPSETDGNTALSTTETLVNSTEMPLLATAHNENGSYTGTEGVSSIDVADILEKLLHSNNADIPADTTTMPSADTLETTGDGRNLTTNYFPTRPTSESTPATDSFISFDNLTTESLEEPAKATDQTYDVVTESASPPFADETTKLDGIIGSEADLFASVSDEVVNHIVSSLMAEETTVTTPMFDDDTTFRVPVTELPLLSDVQDATTSADFLKSTENGGLNKSTSGIRDDVHDSKIANADVPLPQKDETSPLLQVNIWNYLDGHQKIAQNHYFPPPTTTTIKPQHFLHLKETFLQGVVPNDTNTPTVPLEEAEISSLNPPQLSTLNSSKENSDKKQVNSTNNSENSQNNIKNFPNLYQFILHQMAEKNKSESNLNQTEQIKQEVNQNKEQIHIQLPANHHVYPIKKPTFVHFHNQSFEDQSDDLITELPSKGTSSTEETTISTSEAPPNKFIQHTKDEESDWKPAYQPTQNFYQIHHENNNLNSNFLNNNYHNQQTININNPPPLSVLPSLNLNPNFVDFTGEANSLEESENNTASVFPPPTSTSKINETSSYTDNLPHTSKENDTDFSSNNENDINQSGLSESSLIQSGFPESSLIQSGFSESSRPGYPNIDATTPTIDAEELPIDLSTVLHKNQTMNTYSTESTIDPISNIDSATLVNEYIKRVNAVSKVFAQSDFVNPEVEKLIENIAIQSLLSYLLGEEDDLSTKLSLSDETPSVHVNKKPEEKDTAMPLYETLLNHNSPESNGELSLTNSDDISEIAYKILSKLVQESTTEASEQLLHKPTIDEDSSYITSPIAEVDSSLQQNDYQIISPLSPRPDQTNVESSASFDEKSSFDNLLNMFDEAIPTKEPNEISNNDDLVEVPLEENEDLAYDDNISQYDYLVLSDNTTPTRVSFTDSLKNSVTTVTKMISNLVPDGVTFDWCYNNKGCAFALASSLAIGATGALAIPFVVPLGRRKRQMFLGESRIFGDNPLDAESSERVREELQRILSFLALNGGKQMKDGFVVPKRNILKYLEDEFNRIIDWKKAKPKT